MQISRESTVGELARKVPGAARLFEKTGLEFCCSGHRTLGEACEATGLQLDTIIASLEVISAAGRGGGSEKDWDAAPLSELVHHIVDRHHSVVREEVPRLVELIARMVTAHGQKRPEFVQVQSCVRALHAELSAHLEKEEVILFPFILQLDAPPAGGPGGSRYCFSSVGDPISAMEAEHVSAGQLLSEIRGYLEDRSGCPTCQEFFTAFDSFERDLHLHIHLENNVLFPKTIELERTKGEVP